MEKFPVRVDLEVTNICGLRCIMCPRRLMTRPTGFMSMELVKKVITEVGEKKGNNFDHISLHQMGEPLLHPNIVEIVKYIKGFGLHVALTTSATLLSENISRKLLVANVNAIGISLDSLDAEQYAKIRVGASLDVVCHNIDKCIELRQQLPNCETKISLQTIMMRDTVGQGEVIEREYGKRIGSIGGAIIIKKFEQWGGVVSGMTASVEEESGDTPCSQAEIAAVVQWNGDVVVCCMDFDGKTKVGNAYENTIEELWTNDIFNSYRRRIKEGDKTTPHCGTCPHLWKPVERVE